MFHRTYFLFQIVSFLGNRIIGVLPSPNFGIASPLPNGLTPLLRIRWFRVTYCEHWDRLCPGCMRAVVLVLWSAGLRLLIGRAVCWSFMFPAGRSNLSSCACVCVCVCVWCSRLPNPTAGCCSSGRIISCAVRVVNRRDQASRRPFAATST